MQRFYLAVVFGFVLTTLAWLAGLEAQLGAPTPSSRWVFEAYQKKARIAATKSSSTTSARRTTELLDSRRVVLVRRSSLSLTSCGNTKLFR